MVFVHLPSRRRRLRPPSIRLGSPAGEFAVISGVMAAVMAVLAAFLPGAAPLPVGIALAGFGAGAVVAGRALRRSYPHSRLGLCNLVTLGRMALALAFLVPLMAGGGASWPVFAIAALTLSLDGLDGWLARRQGLASAFGARFDMEVDAAFALILAVNAAAGSSGPVAILLGVPRYLFVAAARVLPWMRRDLPERFSRKVVCVLQLGVLILLQAPILPQAFALPLVGIAASALVWSFATDLLWLWRRKRA